MSCWGRGQLARDPGARALRWPLCLTVPLSRRPLGLRLSCAQTHPSRLMGLLDIRSSEESMARTLLELFDDLAKLATRPYVLEVKKPASATLAAASAARNR